MNSEFPLSPSDAIRDGIASDRVVVDKAKQLTKNAGNGIIVVSILMFFTTFFGLYMTFFSKADWTLQILEFAKANIHDEDFQKFMQSEIDKLASRDRTIEIVANAVVAVVGLIANAILLMSGIRMKKLSGHGFCIMGAIVALIFNGCCCAGIPVGIWSLIVLNHPDVIAGFKVMSRRTPPTV